MAANILPFVRIGLDIYHQVKEDQEEDRRSEEARRARQDIRLQYSDLAHQVRAEANATAEEYINEILTRPMEQMQEHADRAERCQAGTERSHPTPICCEQRGKIPHRKNPQHL